MPTPKRQPYTEAQDVTEARRTRLEQLIEAAGGVKAVADRAGIDRVHLEKLIADPATTDERHRRNILAMQAETVTRLLTALGISDTAAVRELSIPEHLHRRWQTLRPQPLGHGERQRQGLLDVVLTEPLVVTLQPGEVITIDTANILSGMVVCRVNGRYLLAPADAIPANGEPLGQFVGADALVRLPTPVPETEAPQW